MHCNSTVTSTGNFVASRSYCIFTVVTFYSVWWLVNIICAFSKVSAKGESRVAINRLGGGKHHH